MQTHKERRKTRKPLVLGNGGSVILFDTFCFLLIASPQLENAPSKDGRLSQVAWVVFVLMSILQLR
jgi:hypothetical protein